VVYRGIDAAFVDSTLDRVVVDEVIDGMPVREFRSFKGQRHYSGWYFSTTMQRLIAYESRLELTRLLVADFDHKIVGIAGQPFQLAGRDGDRIRRHVPDVLLLDADGGVTVVDVKPQHRLSDPKVQALHAWTRKVVALRGWGFEEWSGCGGRRLENIRFLAGYRRAWLVRRDLASAVEKVVGAASTIGEVEWRLRTKPKIVIRPLILNLLWSGFLVTDLDARLGRQSPLVRGSVVDG
jgi:hypothetical protein